MNAFINNGIEFILPGIFKAYPRKWATQFLEEGTIYFTNLSIFQQDDNLERGDLLEGKNFSIRQGIRCAGDYLNPIFVFCSTMETNPNKILSTWTDRDTVIQIKDTFSFVNRIKEAAVKRKDDIYSLQVGPVTYDKDDGSYREYHWAEGIFQKNKRFECQKEYRIALVGNVRIKSEEHVILKLGSCSDIALTIE